MSDCEAGCMVYDGGERKHHKDCRHYAESLSKMYDDQSTLITEQSEEIERLRAFVEEVRDCKPEIHSGRQHDPQYDLPDLIEAEWFLLLQEDAITALGESK